MAAMARFKWPRASWKTSIWLSKICIDSKESIMAKTASFGVMHLVTAFGVSYVLTGDIAIAGAITFVEPVVNTVMHYFHDKYWDRIARWLPSRQASAIKQPDAAAAEVNPA
jgi:uncharacterized membrane protein